MNQKEFYKQLIHRYVTNQATEKELEAFFALLESSDMDGELQEYLDESVTKTVEENIIPIRRYRFRRIVAAAVLLITISIGGYLLLHKAGSQQQLAQQQPTTIQPGGNKAFLTLANGSKISLTDAKNGMIATQGKITISKTADGNIAYSADQSGKHLSGIQYNVLNTPRGGRYEAVLSDGTHFVLDASSSIRYPISFSGNERRVEITGQVYFEVVHNSNRPFRVTVKGQTIEDLGTHFNINAYDDEPTIKTTLIEGRVSINKNVILIPGEQAAIDKDGFVKVEKAEIEQVVAWKKGLFVFDNTNIKDMMRDLSRWYDFEISYKGDMSDVDFQGNYLRSRDLFKLLKAIELTNKVKFKIEGRRVTAIAQ